jgi:hypothetical protein
VTVWRVVDLDGDEQEFADAASAYAAAATAPHIVLGPGWRLVPGTQDAVRALVAALGDTWDAVHLDGARTGSALLLSATGAAGLRTGGSLDALDVRAVDPPFAEEDELDARDLRRVLRYDEAIDPAWEQGLDRVGPELYVMPFWTPAFCATVVRAAEAAGGFAPAADDPVPGHEVSLATISPRLYGHLEADLSRRLWPFLADVWPYAEDNGLRDAFVIRYALGEQEELRVHHDVAQISGSIKLDEGYTGGVLTFPRQGFDNTRLAVGALLVWPSLVTHPHGSSPVTHGVKHNLTVWMELPRTAWLPAAHRDTGDR